MTTLKPVLPGATGPIWRDPEGEPWEEVTTLRYVGAGNLTGELRQPGQPDDRETVERQWGPLTRETPRTWDLPPEPGPEVRAVRTGHGAVYHRAPMGGWMEEGDVGPIEWRHLMRYCSMPLTDATAEVTAETGASA